ncbi:MAG: phage baseplate assembly protein V [Clostridiales bacterium]|nr:phage baseplate assembly protein V [Clostridiales bacterium]
MNSYNLMSALVIDVNDPDNLGRVKIALPALPEGPELWARVVSPIAGEDRGLCLLPEIEDEVLVAFTQGELSSAYILGGLWGKQKPPPEGLGGSENNLKMWRTRSGNTMTFDDKDGEEKIIITDKEENTIMIETSENRITVKAKKKIVIQADGDVAINGGTIKMKADTIEITADSSMTLDGGSTADLKAGTVNIN